MAGIIEGDGSIGMGFHVRDVDWVVAKPTVTFANQDPALIEAVVGLIVEATDKQPYIRATEGRYENSFPVVSVSLAGQLEVAVLLTEIIPYLKGDKGAKAQLLVRFISSRLDAKSRESGSGPPPYSSDDLRTMLRFHKTERRKGGRKNPRVEAVLERQLKAI